MNRLDTAMASISDIADDAGIAVHVHARLVGPGVGFGEREVALDADTQAPMASLYKLQLAACWSDLVRKGDLDATERLVLSAQGRAPGATGVACLGDDVALSARDAVRLMLATSDNAAADTLLHRVGLERLDAWLQAQGLGRTRIHLGSADMLRRVIAETGGRDLTEALALLADPHHDRGTSQYDTALASVSTARDLTTVLAQVWREPHHAWVRESMSHQHWDQRIRSGFPHDDVGVAAKSGTLGRLRHEIGVVTFPGEIPVGVAVLTRAVRPEIHQPRVEAAIGAIARAAVNALRTPV